MRVSEPEPVEIKREVKPRIVPPPPPPPEPKKAEPKKPEPKVKVPVKPIVVVEPAAEEDESLEKGKKVFH